MNVLVVIVNYRSAHLTLDCLADLEPEARELPGLRVTVVDGDSRDGSVEKLSAAMQQRFGRWVELLPLDRNGGFAFGNNAAIRRALAGDDKPDFILLLNPDTRPGPGAVKHLASFLLSNPAAGIAGSRLEDADGRVQCSAHNLPSPLGELDGGAQLGPLSRVLRRYVVSPPQADRSHECEWVSGAAMMVRREVFEQIGLLDEAFFLYFEEVDFCRRARRAGWRVWHVPASRVVHLEGSSTGIHAARTRRPGYWYDSRRRYFVKAYGAAGLIAADALWLMGRISLLIRKTLRLGGNTEGDPKRLTLDLLGGDLRALVRGELNGHREKIA